MPGRARSILQRTVGPAMVGESGARVDRYRKHLQGRGEHPERATSGFDRRTSIAGRPQYRTPETHLPTRKAKIPVGSAQRRSQNGEKGPSESHLSTRETHLPAREANVPARRAKLQAQRGTVAGRLETQRLS